MLHTGWPARSGRPGSGGECRSGGCCRGACPRPRQGHTATSLPTPTPFPPHTPCAQNLQLREHPQRLWNRPHKTILFQPTASPSSPQSLLHNLLLPPPSQPLQAHQPTQRLGYCPLQPVLEQSPAPSLQSPMHSRTPTLHPHRKLSRCSCPNSAGIVPLSSLLSR